MKRIVQCLMLMGALPTFAGLKVADRVPGEYVVGLRAKNIFEKFSQKKAKESLARAKLWSFRKGFENSRNVVVKSDRINVRALQLSDAQQMANLRRELEQDFEVDYIEPNYLYHKSALPQVVPNDQGLKNLWGLHNTGQKSGLTNKVGKQRADIKALEAWGISTGSKNVVVAVIDTGVDVTHPDLRENIWTDPVTGARGYNAIDDNSDVRDFDAHGTHVSGTIGASGNNGTGVVGVNWNVTIMPVKFLGPFGGSNADAVKAIDFAVRNGAHIINASWGGPSGSQAIKEAIKRAHDKGVLFVTAAGNESSDNDRRGSFPGNHNVPNIVSVAASDNRDNLAADFSNYGDKTVHLAAPGAAITSTIPGGYDTYDGTSMASPHVAGAAALLLAVNPGLTHLQVKARLASTSDRLFSLRNLLINSGARINLYRLLMNELTEM